MNSSLDTGIDLAATGHRLVGRTYRPQLATSSVGMLEHADWVRETHWAVDWPEPGVSDVSSLTVPTALAQPCTSASTSLRWDVSQRIAAVISADWFEEVAVTAAACLLNFPLLTPGSDPTRAVERRIAGRRLQWRSGDSGVIPTAPPDNGEVIGSPTQHESVPGAGRKGRLGTDRGKTMSLLAIWLLEDAQHSGDSLERLKSGLDGNRESSRKLFP